jgi:hypothetical protein
MPPTNPYFDRLADIQTHVLSGGVVLTFTVSTAGRYTKAHLGWFSADATGLYVRLAAGRVCLNTATITLTR